MKKKRLKSKFLLYTLQASVFTAAIVAASVLFLYFDYPSQLYLIILAVLIIAFGVSIFFMYRSMMKIIAPVVGVSKNARDITKGLPVYLYEHNEKNELGELADSMHALLDYIHGRVDILDRINEGDYSFHIEPVGYGDRLTLAIIRVVDTNNRILNEIKKVSDEISGISNEVANNAQTLASGSEEQAATVEEFAAVMDEVQNMADHNAEIAKKTLARAMNSKQLMGKSIEDMQLMIDAMEAINNASMRIETVTKVIDEIAFQTNILALNAAVEAARAGVHGKGFAVVADEVRVLASKSAAAAKETEELIVRSISAISEGNGIMQISTEGLTNIGSDAEKAASFMVELEESSENQRESLTEINRGVSQISDVVQSNSALAQHNAVSAQLMSDQSEQLERLVAMYKLREE